MLLVAAAPERLWRARDLGLELFSDGVWGMARVRERNARGFRTWERDGFPARPDPAVRPDDGGRACGLPRGH